MPIRKIASVTATLSLTAALVAMPTVLAFGSKTAITLDLQNPNRALDSVLEPYMISIRRKIQRLWTPTSLSPALKAKVYFEITANGSIGSANIIQSSGNKVFDETALDAIYEGTPFPKIPMARLNIVAAFDNKYLSPTELAQNIRRRSNHGKKDEPVEEHAQLIADNQYEDQRHQVSDHQEFKAADSENHHSSTDHRAQSQREHSDYSSRERKPTHIASSHPQQDIRQWERPLTKAGFSQLSSEEHHEYLKWFQSWLALPPSQLFSFLNSGAQPTTIVKSTRPKGRSK